MRIKHFIAVIFFTIFLFGCQPNLTESVSTIPDGAIATSLIEDAFNVSSTSNYYSYTSTNELRMYTGEFSTMSFANHVSMFFDEQTLENMVRMDMSISMGDISVDMQTVIVATPTGATLYMKDVYSDIWSSTDLSLSDILEMDYGFESMEMSSLLNGLTYVDAEEVDGSVVLTIPLSKDNFSLSMFPDMEDVFTFSYMPIEDQDEFVSLVEDSYHLISCKVTLSADYSTIESIELDYEDFVNAVFVLFGFGDDSLGMEDFAFTQAVLTMSDFSSEPFDTTLPIVGPFGISPEVAGEMVLQLNGNVVDWVIDTENKNLFYTLEGDHYLYSFNYDSFEQHQYYFDMTPERLYLRSGIVYVTLTNGHEYYTSDSQTGGIAEIVSESGSLIRQFTVYFDPYDIVVTKNNEIVVNEGSNQWGSMFLISSTTGSIMDTMSGVYYKSEIEYSDYTGRIYYEELMSTYNHLDVISVSGGEFSGNISGDDDFQEGNMQMVNGGRVLYSLDGQAFVLNASASSDGRIAYYLGFGIYSAAYDDANMITYFATDYGIYGMDGAFDIVNGYEFSGMSIGLTYTEGIFINIGPDYIEILDPSSPGESSTASILSVSYGDDFDGETYIRNLLGSTLVCELVSGTLDTETLGSTVLVYHISKLSGIDVDFTFTLYIQVIDNVAPMLSLEDGANFNLEVGQDYTLPACEVTDNYDDNPICWVYENTINIQVMGDYDVTYRAEDSFGNVRIITYTFSVTPRQETFTTEVLQFSGMIGEAIFDVDNQALYYVVINTKQIIRYDLATSTSTGLTFNFAPEHLLLQDGKLYVTIPTQEHSYYWWEEDQIGYIAIIDSANFTLLGLHEVAVDPYSIAIIGDYIYIAPGSGQWVKMVAYNLNDFSTPIISGNLRQQLVFSYDKNSNYIFAITTDSSPQSLQRFQVLDGRVVGSLDDPGHGDYYYGDNIWTSPNGDFVFSSYGEMFYQIGSINFTALDYCTTVNFNVSDIYMDTTDNLIFFGRINGDVELGNLSTYLPSSEAKIGYPVHRIAGDEGHIYVISYSPTILYFVIATLAE